MTDVFVAGIGQVAAGEHWETSLRHLALHALQGALADAGNPAVDALYVGNSLAGELAEQEHLGALVADFAGLRGVEAARIEAADAAGAAAMRVAFLAVASGAVETALVVGVEKMTDATAERMAAALSTGSDADFEASQGITPVALAALLMRRYMHEYGYERQDFAPFAVNAHRNGRNNPNALFRFPMKAERFAAAPPVCDPISLFDSAPACDGAAAVVLTRNRAPAGSSHAVVRIAASAVATDTVAVHDRRDPLVLDGAMLSVGRAYRQAGVGPGDIDLFELHDSFGIMAALSLEAAGFAERGQGVRLGLDGQIAIEGQVPVSTMGGLKARGHPAGATGIYQIAEVVQQLGGEAGYNQVAGARIGMAQSIGGTGATVITHILERLD
jgi:acetyl-CoA C-acetyltransferase